MFEFEIELEEWTSFDNGLGKDVKLDDKTLDDGPRPADDAGLIDGLATEILADECVVGCEMYSVTVEVWV